MAVTGTADIIYVHAHPARALESAHGGFRYTPAMALFQARRYWLVLVLAMVLGATVGVLTARQYRAPTAVNPGIEGLLWPNPKVLGDFEVTRDDGTLADRSLFLGRWSMVFFGYTHCPDICPITLSVIAGARPQLESVTAPGRFQVVFASVDPGRDDPARISEYVHYFHPGFIGVGGTAAQVQSLTRQFGVAWFVDAPDEAGDYKVDHSASLFVVDPAGRLVAVLGAPHQPQAVIDRFTEVVRFIEGNTG